MSGTVGLAAIAGPGNLIPGILRPVLIAEDQAN